MHRPNDLFFSLRSELACLSSFLNGNSRGNGHTDHRVVAGADETHHLNVSRNGRRTCELCIGVHTA